MGDKASTTRSLVCCWDDVRALVENFLIFNLACNASSLQCMWHA